MALKAHFMLIDPQNDFCDIIASGADPIGTTLPDGTTFRSTLPVPGAVDDMKRVASVIGRIGHKLEDIHVTLDSHRIVDVGHPAMWRNQAGDMPAPFTIISADDIEAGIWYPRIHQHQRRLQDYARALEANGQYQIMIWPPHCLIGTWGHNIQDDVMAALLKWESDEIANVNFVTKGTNVFTEHYGALLAEVPDPNDPATQLNGAFLQVLADADIIGVAGEASSHCVKATVEQVASHIGDEHLKKFHILTDCMSPVPQTPGAPDFPAIAESFLKDMEQRGMVLTTSEDFLR